jgi:hypothetical protein
MLVEMDSVDRLEDVLRTEEILAKKRKEKMLSSISFLT